jgi:hypothetical protein
MHAPIVWHHLDEFGMEAASHVLPFSWQESCRAYGFLAGEAGCVACTLWSAENALAPGAVSSATPIIPCFFSADEIREWCERDHQNLVRVEAGGGGEVWEHTPSVGWILVR